MKRLVQIGLVVVVLTGCTTGDIQTVIQIAMSKDPSAAISKIATQKAINYTSKELATIISDFLKRVEKDWGNESKISTPKEYVKYTQNYKSMAYVNFDTGEILVQTIDDENTIESLKNAIVSTLLTPEDPRAIDLYSDAQIKLSGTPYLYKTVIDHTGNYIRSSKRAENFADFLIANNLKTKKTNVNNKNQTIHFVSIQMVKNHINIRAKKYEPLVEKYANKYNISKNLIFAIMQTESDFNPFAISTANAIGLMQIVPTSAGQDAYQFIYNQNRVPDKEFLYDASNNIQFGAAYLHLLENKYLNQINNHISKEYCVIAAYNTGAGNVLKVFSKNKSKAFKNINKMSPSQIYEELHQKLPFKETKDYIDKVLKNKKNFINI
ncbi:MAG: murein transglycosylase domain-containing protein [Arcobacteraceae bacterium]